MRKIFLLSLLIAASINAHAALIHKSINVNSPEFEVALIDRDTLLVDYSFEFQRTRYPWYYELQCTSNPQQSATIEYTLGGYPLTHTLPVSLSELYYGSKHGNHIETYGQFTIVSTQLKSHVQCKLILKDGSSE